jgi:hypothetical protein
MASRVFAVLIGIDDYKSGRIWNLEACAHDAQRMKQWLMQDLQVPKENIALLLNQEATKRRIEDTFMSHLVNNPAIAKGDALIVYFAGHGSTMRAPPDWCEGKLGSVQVLCPYDHDTKGPEGRIAGISDRSLFAMLAELSLVKGDNITLILDCCFLKAQLGSSTRDRRFIRYTPTSKAAPEDLFLGLWRGAVGRRFKGEFGFFQDDCQSHVLLAACRPGEKALEWKEGGKFTSELLTMKDALPLHQMKSSDLSEHLAKGLTHIQQHPVCVGQRKNRVFLNGVPFVADASLVPVNGEKDRLRLEMGAMHGVVEGTEFSVHEHNRFGSINPSLDSFRVYEVYPTWSLARRKSMSKPGGRGSWARITRWNSRTPFRVYVKKTCSSLLGRLFGRSKNSEAELDGIPVKEGLNIVQVETSAKADMSVGVHTRDVRVQNLDRLVPPTAHPLIRIEKDRSRSGVILSEAARFHMHLHRTNPAKPFHESLGMEIFRVDPHTQRRVGPNLLVDGTAAISHSEGARYAVVLHNHSDTDLWPYLAYMDSNGVDIQLLYHPQPSYPMPPLRKRSYLDIGCTGSGIPPLNFPFPDHQQQESAFLKLFVSTSYTSMGLLEQSSTVHSRPPTPVPPPTLAVESKDQPQNWDTALACVIMRRARAKS